MNGFSKSRGSRIWPVARSSARCGARAGPRLIASDGWGGAIRGMEVKRPLPHFAEGASRLRGRSSRVLPGGALVQLHRSLSRNANKSHANKREDQEDQAEQTRCQTMHIRIQTNEISETLSPVETGPGMR